MPLVNIIVAGAVPEQYRRALIMNTREAIVEGLSATDDRVVIRLSESDPGCFDAPVCRTDRFTLVEILLYEGRSDDMKRSFVRILRERLERSPGIEPSEVAVAFHEMSRADLDILPGRADSQE